MKYGCFKNLAIITLSLASLSGITALGNTHIILKDNITSSAARNLSFVDLIYREPTKNSDVTRINVLEATSSNREVTTAVYNPQRLQITAQTVGQYVNEHYQTTTLKAGPSCQLQNIKQYSANNNDVDIEVSESPNGQQTQCVVNSKVHSKAKIV